MIPHTKVELSKVDKLTGVSYCDELHPTKLMMILLTN